MILDDWMSERLIGLLETVMAMREIRADALTSALQALYQSVQ
jgi:hypothetical protein